MSKNKLRRKTFLSTIGMAAVGWLGIKPAVAASVEANDLPGATNDNTRVRPDPRAVPCSERKL